MKTPKSKPYECRLKAGWTQAQVAEKLDISVPMVSLIEKGERNPSLRLAKKFSELYNEDLPELFPQFNY